MSDKVASKRWHCPKCGLTVKHPLPVLAVIHNCPKVKTSRATLMKPLDQIKSAHPSTWNPKPERPIARRGARRRRGFSR